MISSINDHKNCDCSFQCGPICIKFEIYLFFNLLDLSPIMTKTSRCLREAIRRCPGLLSNVPFYHRGSVLICWLSNQPNLPLTQNFSVSNYSPNSVQNRSNSKRCAANHGLFENPNLISNKNVVQSLFQIVCIKSELKPFDIGHSKKWLKLI